MSQRRSTPALAFVLVALLASGAAAQSRVAFARVELSGPMSTPSLALLEDSPTHLAGALLAGERIERVLPVVVGEGPLRGEPRWRWEGDPERAGRARFLGWSARADESWSALPAGLRARPRPPAEPQHRAPPFALACVLAGLALASAALARKRRWAAALPSLVGAALAWWIAGAGRPESAGELRVLEGEDGGVSWVEVRAGWERLQLEAGRPGFVLRSAPEDAPVELATTLAEDGLLEIRSRAAALWVWLAPSEEPGALGEERQELGALDQVWWRADGVWSYRGAWARGEALPAAREGPPPPGWLASGLPQGPRVCLAHASRAGGTWIRQLGP